MSRHVERGGGGERKVKRNITLVLELGQRDGRYEKLEVLKDQSIGVGEVEVQQETTEPLPAGKRGI